jgi:hypothetical protein
VELVILASIAVSLHISASKINQIQILNITASPAIAARSVFVRLADSNVDLLLYYRVTIPNAEQSAAAYASVLATAVSTGKFTAYMQAAVAKSSNSTALLLATSSSVSLGKSFGYYLNFCATCIVTIFIFAS